MITTIRTLFLFFLSLAFAVALPRNRPGQPCSPSAWEKFHLTHHHDVNTGRIAFGKVILTTPIRLFGSGCEPSWVGGSYDDSKYFHEKQYPQWLIQKLRTGDIKPQGQISANLLSQIMAGKAPSDDQQTQYQPPPQPQPQYQQPQYQQPPQPQYQPPPPQSQYQQQPQAQYPQAPSAPQYPQAPSPPPEYPQYQPDQPQYQDQQPPAPPMQYDSSSQDQLTRQSKQQQFESSDLLMPQSQTPESLAQGGQMN